MNKHIASLTVYTILKTLSNNDYVNILNYSVNVNYTVPCFENKLIQATPENIETFKMAVNNIDPIGKSNAEQGLIESFRLLEEVSVTLTKTYNTFSFFFLSTPKVQEEEKLHRKPSGLQSSDYVNNRRFN